LGFDFIAIQIQIAIEIAIAIEIERLNSVSGSIFLDVIAPGWPSAVHGVTIFEFDCDSDPESDLDYPCCFQLPSSQLSVSVRDWVVGLLL
jgi:hypothetical protein